MCFDLGTWMHRNQWHDRNSWVITYRRVTMFGKEQEIRIQHLYDVFWQINSSPTISIRLHKGRWIHPVHLDIFVIGWSYYKHHQKAHWLCWLLCFCCFLAAVPNLYSAVIQVNQRVACRVQVSTKNVFFKIPPSDWKLICVFNFCTTLCARQFSFFLFAAAAAAVRSFRLNFSQQ